MSFFKNMFGDNRVLASSNPQIQKILTYMNEAYSAYIVEYKERRGNYYMIECRSNFDYLYANGWIDNGHVIVPGTNGVFSDFTSAFDGLLWLKGRLDQ